MNSAPFPTLSVTNHFLNLLSWQVLPAAQEQHPAATGHSTGAGVSAVVCEHHISSVAGVRSVFPGKGIGGISGTYLNQEFDVDLLKA